MDKNLTIKQIIELWPDYAELAADVNAVTGGNLKRIAVYKWHKWGRIPAKYDLAIIQSAAKRNISLTAIDLMNARSVHVDQVGQSGATPQVVETIPHEVVI